MNATTTSTSDPETSTNETEKKVLKTEVLKSEENSLEEAKETVAKAGSAGGHVGWAVCAVAVLSLALF